MAENEPKAGRTPGRTQRQLQRGTKALQPSDSFPKISSSVTGGFPEWRLTPSNGGNSGPALGQNRFHAARAAGRKATASISMFAFSSRPATCTAVLVGGSVGKNSPRMRENTA